MTNEGMKKPKALLPPGAVWETKTDPCLKCRRPYTRRGYRMKDGRWIGSHLCFSCNETNKNIREPRMMGRVLIARKRVREM